jgi:response regulator NasT
MASADLKIDTDVIRVLIADDEPLIRMDLKELLEESPSYHVIAEAKDGAEAIEMAKQYDPDVIFLDIRMPGMDGIEAAKQIQQESNRRIPIIMLTAYSQQELYEEASKAGVFAYLTKPLRKPDLAPAIEIAIARALELQELNNEVSKLNEKMETRKLVEKAKGVIMKKFGLDEAEAYRAIQKQSMDKRMSLRQVAQQVLDAGK